MLITKTSHKMITQNIPSLRLFQVKYFGPTNKKPTRIRIKDIRNNETRFIPLSSEMMEAKVILFLKNRGIETNGTMHLVNSADMFYLTSENLSTSILNK